METTSLSETLHSDWQAAPLGQEVFLEATSGASARIMAWGAVLRDLLVPDRAGSLRRVVLGFESPASYPDHSPHFGAIAGPFANRIRNGLCRVDGVEIRLDRNQDGRHHLHGGAAALGQRPWTIVDANRQSVTLANVTPSGLGGYPATIHSTCCYTLLAPATFRVDIQATSSAPTPLNLCHHSYFNLDGSSDVGAHKLLIAAEAITVADGDRVPTGAVSLVEGTPFDFRAARRVDALAQFGGLDQNFILARAGHPECLFRAARLDSPGDDLALEVWTTEPGLQAYDGHKLNVAIPGHGGMVYGIRAGIALEPQRFPDTPNHAHFGSATLYPGQLYRQLTEYRFL